MEQKIFSKYGKLIHIRIKEETYWKLCQHAVDKKSKVNKLIIEAVEDLVKKLGESEVDWENPDPM